MAYQRTTHREQYRTLERPAKTARPAIASKPADTMLALQATAGNASVVRQLQRQRQEAFAPHEDPRITDASAFRTAYGELPRTGRGYIDEWVTKCHLVSAR